MKPIGGRSISFKTQARLHKPTNDGELEYRDSGLDPVLWPR